MKFLDSLQKSGDIIQACIESGISAEQYKELYDNRPGFKDSVNAILTGHSITLDEKIRQLGQYKLIELLEHGTTVHKQSKKVTFDENGEIYRQEIKTESVHFPTPEWAIKHAIAQRDEIENALIVLARESMIPVELVRRTLSELMQTKKNIRGLFGESQESTAELSQQAIVQAQAALLGLTTEQLSEASNRSQ